MKAKPPTNMSGKTIDNAEDQSEWLPANIDDRGQADVASTDRRPRSEQESREMFPWGLPGTFGPLPVRRGPLRSDFSTITVKTDAEAVAAWIAEKAHKSTNTAQSYRREAERLMLWASEVKDKALSELMREDFIEFAGFLSDPNPADAWISDKRWPRSSPKWRPFMGPLSPSSSRQTQIIIGSLFRYLHAKNWIRANPVPDPIVPSPDESDKGETPKYVGEETGGPLSRSLSQTQWDAVEKALAALPSDNTKQYLFKERARWLLTLFYSCGPRVSEVATHGMGTIKPDKYRDRTIWVWHVTGKGNKTREVPLSTDVVNALCRFRGSLGLPPYPTPLEPTPLAPSFWKMKADGHLETNSLRPLTRQSLYNIVTGIMESAAELLGEGHPEYQHLKRASTHWLRHTALKDLADNTDDIRHVQQMAGHADIKTTMIYTTAKTHELYDAVEGARSRRLKEK